MCASSPTDASYPPDAFRPASVDACAACSADPDAGLDAAHSSTRFAGYVEQIGPFHFGGSPYCEYLGSLMRVSSYAEVGMPFSRFEVQYEYVEEGIACPFPPLDPNLHRLEMASAAQFPDGSIQVLLSQSSGMPVVEAEWLGRREADGHFAGDLIVRRLFTDPPLDWTVGYIVSLYPAP